MPTGDESLSTIFGLKVALLRRRTVSRYAFAEYSIWSSCDLDLWPFDFKIWSV